MIFDSFPIARAKGILLAHTVRFGSEVFSKGRRISAHDVAVLSAHGINEISGALLEENDVDENIAAQQIAAALAGDGVAMRRSDTGRCNLYAKKSGLVVIATDVIDRINLSSAEVTVATLPAWSVVRQGDRIATVKIIPFATRRELIEECCTIAQTIPALTVASFVPHRVALIVTELAHTKKSLLKKAVDVTRQRVEALNSQLAITFHCHHDLSAVRAALTEVNAAGCDIILVCGAAVTMDVNDIVPAAVVAAGGEIEHFGMPVEPGNMLLLARIGKVPIINLPGCARSPSENGFDKILRRLLAKLPVSGRDLMLMGVGGLIREHSSVALLHDIDTEEALATMAFSM